MEVAGHGGVCMEPETQHRTLTWNQESTLPSLLDSQAYQSFHEALNAQGLSPSTSKTTSACPQQINPSALCMKSQEILHPVDLT